MMAISEKIEEHFSSLAGKKVEKPRITGLGSPDHEGWSGGQVNLGHTQGIACWGDWLVLTNNQKAGAGYIALCKRINPNPNEDYKHVSHVKDLDNKETLYYHPGGIQMFDYNGKTWVAVPFEKDGYEVQSGVNTGFPTYYERSEIRFYYIQGEELKYEEGITIRREGKKAGSVGVTKTNDLNNNFILAAAYKDNAVDFYAGNPEKGFGTEPFSTLSGSEKRPSYVNAISLLPNGNSGCYLVGLTGETFKCSDLVYASEVDLSKEKAKIKRSLHFFLKSKLRSKWYGPSFRWGGSLSLQNGKLSVVAAERMIDSEEETQIAVLESS